MSNEKPKTFRFSGRDWETISIAEYRERFPERVGKTFIPKKGFFILPYSAPDDRLDFPRQPAVEGMSWFVCSGVTDLEFDKAWQPDELPPDRVMPGFTARRLRVFKHSNWHKECMDVLSAHSWTDEAGQIALPLMDKLVDLLSEDGISLAKREHGDTWEYALFEVAATHFATPLSRLWYAANMLALHYVHNDDMRLGYLWAEYRIKMKHELLAIKKAEEVQTRRNNGKLGGQGEKKRERYRVLNELARSRPGDFAFKSDSDGIRAAKRLAEKYDKATEEGLFQVSGRSLSKEWYSDWLSQFRLSSQGRLDQ